MPRAKTGYTVTRKGKLYAGITYTAADGKRKFRERRVEKKSDAPKVTRELLNKLDTGGPELIDGERITMAELIERHTYHRWPKSAVEAVKAAFGKRMIRSLTWRRCQTGRLTDHQRARSHGFAQLHTPGLNSLSSLLSHNGRGCSAETSSA